MAVKEQVANRTIAAIRVIQWLNEWGKIPFDPRAHRSRPDPHFYLFTLPADDLKALTGIQRRTLHEDKLRSLDLGIQRRHEEERSKEIGEFVSFGYPWSQMSASKRNSGRFDDLRKPGWLPTAIVVNILKPNDKRRGQVVASKDIIQVTDKSDQGAIVTLPTNFSGSMWRPSQLYPIEVIDGQHRLWAFDDQRPKKSFQFPVVAFHGLDISWQAYIFWTINIKPKRINASLAFDLYPLLRTETWLEQFEGHSIYRETRAQELVESLWSHPDSPWFEKINMLGEPMGKETMVTQAAWIRSLMATYIKSWEGRGTSIGGLFAAKLTGQEEALPWSRAQQAAFLILVGQRMRDAVAKCKEQWAKSLRQNDSQTSIKEHDPAFFGSQSLLNTDQGIRALLYVTNDLCYLKAKDLKLAEWSIGSGVAASDERSVSNALRSLKENKVTQFLSDLTTIVSKYDWRTSSALGLTERQQTFKAAFRGSGGYKELRREVLRQLSHGGGEVAKAANSVLKILGYI